MIRTGRLEKFHVVVVDSDFKKPFEALFRGDMNAGLIDADDLDAVLLADDMATGVEWINSHVGMTELLAPTYLS